MEKKSLTELRAYLSRYQSFTCPDNFYLAWRILFDGISKGKAKDKDIILEQALEDLNIIKGMPTRKMFRENQTIPDKIKWDKYNW